MQNSKGKYVVQRRFRDWEPWETMTARFDSPEQAQAYIDNQPFPSIHRVAESYTVERFKAYKPR